MVIKETTTTTSSSSTTSRRDSNGNPNKEKAKGKTKESPTSSAGFSPTKSSTEKRGKSTATISAVDDPLKGKCICEICTCGDHKCRHNDFRVDHVRQQMQSGDVECVSTESRDQYKAHSQAEKSHMKRSQMETTIHVEHGDQMELHSSYQDEFQRKEAEARKRMRIDDVLEPGNVEIMEIDSSAMTGGGNYGQMRRTSTEQSQQGQYSTSSMFSSSQEAREMSESSVQSTSQSKTMASSSSHEQQLLSSQQLSSEMTGHVSSTDNFESSKNIQDMSSQKHLTMSGPGGGNPKKRIRGGKIELVPDDYLYPQGHNITSTTESFTELQKSMQGQPESQIVTTGSSSNAVKSSSSQVIQSSSSSKTEGQLKTESSSSQKVSRGATVTRQVLKDGKWVTVEERTESSESSETVPDMYLYPDGVKITSTSESLSDFQKNMSKTDSSNTSHQITQDYSLSTDQSLEQNSNTISSSSNIIKDKTVSSTSPMKSPQNGQSPSISHSTIYEVDKSTGKRIIRGPATTKRVLKGEKLETIFVPGEIYQEGSVKYQQALSAMMSQQTSTSHLQTTQDVDSTSTTEVVDKFTSPSKDTPRQLKSNVDLGNYQMKAPPGKRAVRGEPTIKRVLKGGKFESITIPGEIYYVDDTTMDISTRSSNVRSDSSTAISSSYGTQENTTEMSESISRSSQDTRQLQRDGDVMTTTTTTTYVYEDGKAPVVTSATNTDVVKGKDTRMMTHVDDSQNITSETTGSIRTQNLASSSRTVDETIVNYGLKPGETKTIIKGGKLQTFSGGPAPVVISEISTDVVRGKDTRRVTHADDTQNITSETTENIRNQNLLTSRTVDETTVNYGLRPGETKTIIKGGKLQTFSGGPAPVVISEITTNVVQGRDTRRMTHAEDIQNITSETTENIRNQNLLTTSRIVDETTVNYGLKPGETKTIIKGGKLQTFSGGPAPVVISEISTGKDTRRVTHAEDIQNITSETTESMRNQNLSTSRTVDETTVNYGLKPGETKTIIKGGKLQTFSGGPAPVSDTRRVIEIEDTKNTTPDTPGITRTHKLSSPTRTGDEKPDNYGLKPGETKSIIKGGKLQTFSGGPAPVVTSETRTDVIKDTRSVTHVDDTKNTTSDTTGITRIHKLSSPTRTGDEKPENYGLKPGETKTVIRGGKRQTFSGGPAPVSPTETKKDVPKEDEAVDKPTKPKDKDSPRHLKSNVDLGEYQRKAPPGKKAVRGEPTIKRVLKGGKLETIMIPGDVFYVDDNTMDISTTSSNRRRDSTTEVSSTYGTQENITEVHESLSRTSQDTRQLRRDGDVVTTTTTKTYVYEDGKAPVVTSETSTDVVKGKDTRRVTHADDTKITSETTENIRNQNLLTSSRTVDETTVNYGLRPGETKTIIKGGKLQTFSGGPAPDTRRVPETEDTKHTTPDTPGTKRTQKLPSPTRPADEKPDNYGLKPGETKTIIKGGKLQTFSGGPAPDTRRVPETEDTKNTTPDTPGITRTQKLPSPTRTGDEKPENYGLKPGETKSIIKGGKLQTFSGGPAPDTRRVPETEDTKNTTPDTPGITRTQKLPSPTRPADEKPDNYGLKPGETKTVIRGGKRHTYSGGPAPVVISEITTDVTKEKDTRRITHAKDTQIITSETTENIRNQNLSTTSRTVDETIVNYGLKPGETKSIIKGGKLHTYSGGPAPEKPKKSPTEKDTRRDTKIHTQNNKIVSTSSEEKHESHTSSAVESTTIEEVSEVSVIKDERQKHQFRGSQLETMTGGTTHDFGDVQGLTVVTHSKSSMQQTEDQVKAQAQLENLATQTTVYGVNYEKTLKTAQVRGIHEREISRGIVRITEQGIETTEDVERSITEMKAADVSSDLEVAEKIVSTTSSSDRQTFKFEELTAMQQENQMRMLKQSSDTTTRKVGQAMVEDVYDVKTTFESRDSKDVKSVAVADENYTATTYLEKHEGDKKPETTYVVYPRPAPVRHVDNLQMEGTTEYRTTSQIQYDEKQRIERPKLQRQNTWTKQEGEMYLETTAKTEYKEFPLTRQEIKRYESTLKPEGEFYTKEKQPAPVGERSKPVKYKDNIVLEGDFFKPDKKEAPVGERARPIKQTDNLYPEGDFMDRPVQQAPMRGDRADIRKPQDNLKTEGDFYQKPKEDMPVGERARPVKQSDNLFPEGQFYERPSQQAPMRGERADVRKPVDNLKSEGDFYSRPKEDFPVGQRSQPIRQHDNLKPEGEWYDRPTAQAPMRGDKADVKRPVDNLRPEGEHYRAPKQEAPVGERSKPIRQADNLFPEGEFTERIRDQAPLKGDRADIRKPQDNLRPEGDFYSRPKEDVPVGQRSQPIRQHDNLKPEGEWYDRPTAQAPMRGDKADVKRPVDNLRPEGEHYRAPKQEAPVGERSKPIRQADNLFPEGEFTERIRDQAPLKGDRADIRKPQDNLRPEGDFYSRPKEDFPVGQRSQPIRQHDNLKPEGEWYDRPTAQAPLRGDKADVKRPVDNLRPEGEHYRAPKQEAPVGERSKPIRQADNLFPEGEFTERIRDQAPLKGDRADIRKPQDNLRPEGDFYSRPKEDFPVGQRSQPIRQHDNLKPEGEWYDRPTAQAPMRGEKADVKRPVDNLRPEGEHYRAPKHEAPVGERSKPIRQADNLFPEGEFTERIRDQAPLKGDRADIRKPQDNLRPEGDFYSRPKEDFPVGQRSQPIRQHDNLKPEGEWYDRPTAQAPMRGEKADVKRPVDNLRPEGEHYRAPKHEAPVGERSKPIRQADNLFPEGEFTERIRDQAPLKGDRADIRKPQDNLRPEGEFYSRPKEDFPVGQRSQPIRQHDNLKPEGEWYDRPTAQAPLRGDKADVKRPVDNLRPEGEHYRAPKHEAPVGERSKPIRQADNLFPEGEFTERIRDQAPLKGDRADIRKPQDNLRPEGEFYSRPKEDFPVGQRSQPIRQHDNLKPEGEWYDRPTAQAPLRGEKADVKRPVDNLRPEGEHYRAPKHEAPVGERSKPIRQADNLFPEGEFTERIRDQAPLKGDRADIRKPQDNLRPEGDFYSRPKEDFPVGQRSQPIRQHDNLKPEGEWYDRPTAQAPMRGEKADVKRPVDNLRPEGEHYRAPKHEAPVGERSKPIRQADNLFPEGEFTERIRDQAPLKGDRADIRKPQDNLRPEGDFYSRPKEDVPVGQRSQPIRQHDNLRPEGEWYDRPTAQAPLKGERADVKRPVDNLRPEGEHYRAPKQEAPMGERTKPIRQADNLFPEGEFTERIRDQAPLKGDRADIRKPQDNLRPEGDFYQKPKEDMPVGERARPVKQSDNLFPEGQFYERPTQQAPLRGERADVRRPVDNLKTEGDFYQKPKEDLPVGERARPVKQSDNLFPEGQFYERPTQQAPLRGERADVRRPVDNLKTEGDFYQKPKEDMPVGERARPVKQSDNLFPEGQFYERPTQQAPLRGERADVRRPVDNLKTEGDFYQKPKEDMPVGERARPVKQSDNLFPEGQFYERPSQQAPLRGERADVRRPVDNLKTEGDFYQKPKEDMPVGERARPVKQSDNLFPEGQFYERPSQQAPLRGERADVRRPVDNLKTEGDFYSRPKEEVPVGQRSQPIRQHDNLKPEGEWYDRPTAQAPLRGDKADVKRPVDNLRPEGEHYRAPKHEAPVGERSKPIRQADNLFPEGEFTERIRDQAPLKGDRADVRKPQDNLRPEGDFYSRPKEDVPVGQRSQPIRQHDNLKPEGEWYDRPTAQAPLRGEKADVKRPVDNLRPEGEHYRSPKKEAPVGERSKPIRQTDNLFPEGEFTERIVEQAPLKGDRAVVKRPQDNLRTEGEFVDRVRDVVVLKGERAEKIIHKDTLKMEGNFTSRTSAQEEYKQFTRGERAEIVRHEDNLKLQGEFEKRTKEVVLKGERAERVIHEDTLKLEGNFMGRTVSQEQFKKVVKGERAEIVRHEDNLRLEARSNFSDHFMPPIRPNQLSIEKHDTLEFNHPASIPKLESQQDPSNSRKFYSLPIVHQKSFLIKPSDNLCLQGEHSFDSLESSPKKYPKPLVGDRAIIKRQPDNLKLDGVFYGFPTNGDGSFEARTDFVSKLGLSPRHMQRGAGERRSLRYPRAVTKPVIFDDRLLNSSAGDLSYKPPPQFQLSTNKNSRDASEYHASESQNLQMRHVDYPDNKTNLYQEGSSTNDFGGSHVQEGNFEARSKTEVLHGERRKPIRHGDNLFPEGQFYERPLDSVPVKGERSPTKIPKDNLSLTGPMDMPQKPSAVPMGERAMVVRHTDNLTVGEGSMSMETTTKSQQRNVIDTRSNKQTTIRKQMASQIVLGEELGDARFDRTVTAKRTTSEGRNLTNGHMTIDKSMESTTRQGAETKTSADRSIEQKIITQAMGAKSSINQNIILNDMSQQKQIKSDSSKAVSSTTSSTGQSSSAMEMVSSQNSSSQSSMQVHANKQGTREVQVTREVIVTKKAAPGGGEIITTTTTTRGLPSSQVKSITSNSTVEQNRSTMEQQNLSQSTSTSQNMVTSSTSSAQDSLVGSSINRQSLATSQSNNMSGQQKVSSHQIIGSSQLNQNQQINGSSQLAQNQQVNGSSRVIQNQQMGSSQIIQNQQMGSSQLNQSQQMTSSKQVMSSHNESHHQSSTSQNQSGSMSTSETRQIVSSPQKSQQLQSSITSNQTQLSTADRNASSINVTGRGQVDSRWSSRDEAVAKGNFAASLRAGGTSDLSQSQIQSQSRSQLFQGQMESDNRFASSSAAYGSHCALHQSGGLSSTTRQSPSAVINSGTITKSQGAIIARTHQQQLQQQQQRLSSQQLSQQQSSFSTSNNSSSTQQQMEVRLIGGRVQRVVRADNLSIGKGSFDTQTSSKSYGQFQVQERIVPVKSTQHSSISLGSFGKDASYGSTSYRKEFVQQQQVKPSCPATHIESTKSPFKLERQTSSHRFFTKATQ